MKIKGDRIVQIILLMLIAAGVASISLNSKGGNEKTAMMQGAPGSTPGNDDSSETVIAVEAMEIERQTVSQFIKINGDVVAENTVEIFSDTAGKIISKNISIGDFVRKGDTVAIVDPSLPGKKYSPSIVSSTISGTITAYNYQVGDTITTQNAITTVGDLKDLQIETFIPERFVSSVKLGLNAEITFEALGSEVFTGVISEISPVIDTTSRTMAITLTLNKQDDRIKVGMFSSIKLITKIALNTLAVANSAVTSYYDENIVYVVKDGNTVERRTVELGLTSDEIVEITSGISEGEIIVIQGQSYLSDGSFVKVVSN